MADLTAPDAPPPPQPAAPAKPKRANLFDQIVTDSTEVTSPASKIFVYDGGVRLWHWINAVCILVLCVTGYLIGSPPPSVGGEAYESFLFGNIRMVHFTAGQILAIMFLFRIYWAFGGNHHARQLFLPPVWSGKWWSEVLYEMRWYSFLQPRPKKYVGHNPLAQLAMFTLFVLPLVFMIFTGFALYAEGQGTDTWWFAMFGWVIFALGGNSMFVHTVHHLGMWVIIIFAIVHIYAAVREDVMSRQSLLSTMISGWRYFKDDKE